MAGAGTDGCGVVSAETAFTFEQTANVVSARYRGGEVVDGYLIGHLSGERLHFRYVQADKNGALDAGVSDCDLERLADGRLRLVEHFQWITREGRGTNVFEEIAR
jgi:hypothetical protein